MLRVGTLFSGIGAAEYALRKMGVEHQVLFAGDIDKYVKKAYFANYNMEQTEWHNDVTTFDAKPYEGKIDVLIGGSPCQSFSAVGNLQGFEDTRGTLFFEYARVLSECKPEAFIFENVKNILYHDGGRTFKVILDTFKSLGYNVSYKVLNAVDYGIPQVRNRVFVVGFKNHSINYEFPDPQPLTLTVQDLLEQEVDERYFLNQRYIDNYVFTQWGTWNKNPQVDKPIASTLTCKMGCLRATQDNYQTHNGRLRKLTPREGLRLMGYGDDFNIVCSNTQTYKQVGNSIVVDVIGAVLTNIIKALEV